MSIRWTFPQLAAVLAAIFQPRAKAAPIAEEKKRIAFELTDDEAEKLMSEGW